MGRLLDPATQTALRLKANPWGGAVTETAFQTASCYCCSRYGNVDTGNHDAPGPVGLLHASVTAKRFWRVEGVCVCVRVRVCVSMFACLFACLFVCLFVCSGFLFCAIFDLTDLRRHVSEVGSKTPNTVSERRKD